MNIKWISFPDYFNYHKEKAINELETKFNFKRYPYKHYESILTRFYQGYILPKKFGIDKRKVHLSTLILNGELTRKAALELLSQSPYPDQADLKSDLKFFLDKMEWSHQDLDFYIKRPRKEHIDFGSSVNFQNFLRKLKYLLA